MRCSNMLLKFVLIEYAHTQNNWTKLHEEDRYYNWYHGYSRIMSPSYSRVEGPDINLYSEYYLYSSVETVATSGVVTTQYYGEQYQPELVERSLEYYVKITPPKSVNYNENVTLHLKLEKVPMAGLSLPGVDKLFFDNIDADETTVYMNFTPPGIYHELKLERSGISEEEVDQQNLDMMPGFRFSWWCSGAADITPDNEYKKYEHNKLFIR